MANNITKRVILIDTASATEVTGKTFKVNVIRWVSKSAVAGDDVEIQDKNGNPLWTSVAAGANYVEESHHEIKPLIFEGLIVPTLDNGTIYLYIESPVPIPT